MHLQWWQGVILGLVEGITEYLPVSSTGHLIIVSSLLGLDQDASQRHAVNVFNIVVQGGAILAVLGLYRDSVWSMLRGLLGKDPAGFRLAMNLFIAFLPAACIGLLLHDWIERHLFSPGPVVGALIVGGVFMIALEWWRTGRIRSARTDAEQKDVEDVTARQALFIGLCQCLAMWPGTSRSLMSIAGGVIVGLRPAAAARFSFLLGLPTLGAATLYALAKNLTSDEVSVFDLGIASVLLGIAVAAVSAALAVKWLVSFLTRHGLEGFGWYRIVLGIVMIGLMTGGVVSFPVSDEVPGGVAPEVAAPHEGITPAVR